MNYEIYESPYGMGGYIGCLVTTFLGITVRKWLCVNMTAIDLSKLVYFSVFKHCADVIETKEELEKYLKKNIS